MLEVIPVFCWCRNWSVKKAIGIFALMFFR